MADDQAQAEKLPDNLMSDVGEDRSYEQLCFGQIRSCCWIGSQDRQNSGVCRIADKDGQQREIVRINWGDAFLNAVNVLVALVRAKIRQEYKDMIYPVGRVEDAYDMFSLALVYLAKHTNVLGPRYDTEYLSYDKAKYGKNPKAQ